jgi:2-polyprenyl-6-methoxyphenol hydroxylase-like FAD-dependent oxidoreductase
LGISAHTRASVAVVGYGPTGQVLALLLARKGHRVTVVERWPDLYPLPRAVHFDQEAARILQAAGVINDVNRVTEDIDVYEWRNGRHELLLALDWTGDGISGWPASTMFSQPELERVFDRHIKANPLITVLQGWEAVALSQDSNGVTLTAEHGEIRDGAWVRTGEQTTVHTGYAVGADGANSFVRRALGIDVHDLGFAFDWLVLDVKPKEAREWKPKTWQLCDPARPTTVVPGGPGRRRWEFMLLPGEEAREMNRAAVAWSLLAPWDVRPDNAELERHAVYTFRGQWAKRWREGRVFIAGDAAHLMPPFAGQGMCSGLRDACALAWRLDLALRGLASGTVFDSYGPERTGHVRTMIEFSIELGKVICITDPELAAERDAAMLADRARPDYVSPPPLLPRLGPGLFIEDDPGSGQLGPQGQLESGEGRGLFDDVFGNGFALVARTRADLAGLSRGNREALASLGGVVVAADEIGDTSNVYRPWLESLGCAAVLTRPDFYVFGSAASAGEVDDLVSGLLAALAGDTARTALKAGAGEPAAASEGTA